MTLATRISVKYRECFESDQTKIESRYTVDGIDKPLLVYGWISPESLEEPVALKWVLQNMDDEAEWCAAHPDDVTDG